MSGQRSATTGAGRRLACFVFADGATVLDPVIPDAIEGWTARRAAHDGALHVFQTYGSGSGPVLAIAQTGSEDDGADGVVVFVERPMKLFQLAIEAAREQAQRWNRIVDAMKKEQQR